MTRFLCLAIPLTIGWSVAAGSETHLIRAKPVDKPDYYAWVSELKTGPSESAKLSDEEYETKPHDIPRGRHFRVAALTSEIYSSAYIEEVVFGYEGCCKRVAHIWKFDLEELFDQFKLKGDLAGFTLVKWEDPRSFQFRLQGALYRASGLGTNQIKVEKLGG